MLQIAFGGYYLVEDGIAQFIEFPSYYEPGFNVMTPLEIQGNTSDYFYLLLRKRNNAKGTAFDTITPANISTIIKDASTGDTILSNLSTNSIYVGWDDNPSDVSPLVLKVVNAIDLASPVVRVRTIDCYIKDTTDNDFIDFRVLIGNTDRYFHYISVGVNTIASRNTYTIAGREAYVRVSNSTDHYVLFSPYAYLTETTKALSDFSYPLNSIFYKRQKTYNNEDYSFSIASYSHSFVPDMISVMNVPSYGKAAVILIDAMMYTHLMEGGENASVDISVGGELSGIFDTFTINFLT